MIFSTLFESFRPGLLALPLLALIASSSLSAAEEKWYKVELIVFEHSSLVSRSQEAWAHEIALPDFTQAHALIPLFDSIDQFGDAVGDSSALIPIPFQQLADIQRDMRGVLSQLELSKRYRPLLHTGWIQPPYPQEESKPVRIVTNDEVEKIETETEITEPDNPTQPLFVTIDTESEAEIEEEAHQRPPKEIDGLLRLSVARYIHLELDLYFNELVDGAKPLAKDETTVFPEMMPLAPPENGDTEVTEEEEATPPKEILRQFRISEKRRVRSKELHYFDHPRFGAVVQVTPIQVIIPSEEDANATINAPQQVIR